MNATIVDLRYRMKNVLLAIDRGETVTVLYRGREKAKLVPIAPDAHAEDKGAAKTKDQPFFGLWKDREDLADPASYVRELRKPRRVPGETVKKRSSTGKPK